MSVRVVILKGAEGDLRELRHYVARRFGETAWARTLHLIRVAMEQIGTHPEAGRVPDEIAALGLVQFREVMAGPNRIVYEPRGDVAYVHLVCDSRRDLKNVLLRRLVEAV
jgi:plasmid stabilization system protein ParE